MTGPGVDHAEMVLATLWRDVAHDVGLPPSALPRIEAAAEAAPAAPVPPHPLGPPTAPRDRDAGGGVCTTRAPHGQLIPGGRGGDEHRKDGKIAPASRPSTKMEDEMKTTKTLPMQVRHQNWMLAVRELGRCAGVAGQQKRVALRHRPRWRRARMELARLAQEAERDVICAHWANAKAKRPSGYTVVLRDVLSVNVASDCKAYLREGQPLALVSQRRS